MSKKRKSAVIDLLDLVWANCNQATAHSWERLNHSMRDALSLAIGAGFEFAEGDIAHVIANYRSGYWIGESDEWIYGSAIQVSNMSAIKSYEAHRKREPYLADDVGFRGHSSYTHGGGDRQRERLFVGCSFAWKGLTLTVTSFSKDQSFVNACSYKKVKAKYGDYDHDKIDKRFKISRADLLAERKERKERDDLLQRLTKACQGDGMAEQITKALGVKSKSDYARLPIAKIRKVAERYAPTTEAAA